VKDSKTLPLPCEECIALAACISKPAVECKRLYIYLCSYHQSGDGYTSAGCDLTGLCWNAYRVNALELRFRRKVSQLMKSNFAILFGPKEA